MAIQLRPATLGDSERLYQWRTELAAAAASFAPAPSSRDDHRRWLAATLEDERRRLFVAEREDGTPVGMVRLDQLGHHAIAQVSIVVEATQRGQGVGTAMLAAACETAFAELRLQQLVALIRAENTASRRLFARLGFRARPMGGRHIHAQLSRDAARGAATTEAGSAWH
jgi:RimJ/RimL family protein N-acetyltransferase